VPELLKEWLDDRDGEAVVQKVPGEEGEFKGVEVPGRTGLPETVVEGELRKEEVGSGVVDTEKLEVGENNKESVLYREEEGRTVWEALPPVREARGEREGVEETDTTELREGVAVRLDMEDPVAFTVKDGEAEEVTDVEKEAALEEDADLVNEGEAEGEGEMVEKMEWVKVGEGLREMEGEEVEEGDFLEVPVTDTVALPVCPTREIVESGVRVLPTKEGVTAGEGV